MGNSNQIRYADKSVRDGERTMPCGHTTHSDGQLQRVHFSSGVWGGVWEGSGFDRRSGPTGLAAAIDSCGRWRGLAAARQGAAGSSWLRRSPHAGSLFAARSSASAQPPAQPSRPPHLLLRELASALLLLVEWEESLCGRAGEGEQPRGVLVTTGTPRLQAQRR